MAQAAKTASKTVTDTVQGEHTHTIVGYSLVKGIGDGEPVASERFVIGGHEWVLLFYPDGKRSSSEGPMGDGPHPAGAADGVIRVDGLDAPLPVAALPAAAPPAANPPAAVAPPHMQAALHVLQRQQPPRRDTTNDYAALFVALIGEGPSPLGVVSTNEGKVVRAFHRFTLVDQAGQGRDLTKGRTRDAGAVKISCARQDPNARNCHGYRKFVKRTCLEDPAKGYLLNDTIVIKYSIELVVSSGGLAGHKGSTPKQDSIRVPPPCLGSDLGALLLSGDGADTTFEVEDEQLKVHKVILSARSPVFRALLSSDMREGREGKVVVHGIRPSVFRTLMHYVYNDTLPEEVDCAAGGEMSVEMAQHLLMAADQYQLDRLRSMCEKRLCETVDADTVVGTLTLAEQNHAEELKKVCLDYVSRNLSTVMSKEGFVSLTTSHPQLQGDILQTIASMGTPAMEARTQYRPPSLRARDPCEEDSGRRVRPRRDMALDHMGN